MNPTASLVPISLCLAAICASSPSAAGAQKKPKLVTKASDGSPAGTTSRAPAVSEDGRYVAFATFAADLAGETPNGEMQVLVWDRKEDEFELASQSSGGVMANDTCVDVEISADGRYVVFTSEATNLTFIDMGGHIDAFRHDRFTNTTVMMSVNDSGVQANQDCRYPKVSEDGRYVGYVTDATNIAPNDNGFRQIVVRDAVLETTRIVSTNFENTPANDDCSMFTMSADGQRIAFQSEALNLGSSQAPAGQSAIWLRDLDLNHNTLVSASKTTTEEPDGYSIEGVISPNGRYVAFNSTANNLVPNDDNPTGYDLFLFDSKKNKLERLEVNAPGVVDSGWYDLSFSSNGSRLAMRIAENGADGGDSAIGIWDVKKEKLTLASVKKNGKLAAGEHENSRISADGKYVVFSSDSTEMGPDEDSFRDIFLFKP